MSRTKVTVCWDQAAESDLAEIWLNSTDRSNIEVATNEIDQLLRVEPWNKGLEIVGYGLESEDVATVESRSIDDPRIDVPPDLRILKFGPLEVLFTVHELDREVIIWLARQV